MYRRGYRGYSYRNRTSYRPRAGYSQRYRSYGSRMNSDASKQLAVARYPHSTATSSPKIPDGSKTVSVGNRVNKFEVRTFPEQCNKMYIFMHSNYITPVTWYWEYTSGDNEGTAYTSLGGPYLGNPPVDVLPGPGTNIQINHTVRSWRCINVGLRIRCTNNDSQDSGCWKAARYQADSDTHGKVFRIVDDKINGFGLDFPNIRTNAGTLDAIPTFNSGLLKDIGSHYFQLRDNSPGSSHPWIWQERNFILGEEAYVAGTNDLWYRIAADTNRTGNDLEDLNVDTMIIEIQGVGGVTSVALDMVYNWEYIAGSPETTQFMDECAFAPTAYEKMKQRLRLTKFKA